MTLGGNFDRGMMTESNRARAEKLANEVSRLYLEDVLGPFPYEGSRALLDGLEEEFEGFIPDLSLWCARIAGYCSYGKKILSLPENKLLEARGLMSLSFFAEHPEYAVLERWITESFVPDLHEYLRLYEELRVKLLELFDILLSESSEPKQ